MIKRYFLVVILLINFTKSNAQKEEIIAGTIGAGIAIFAAAAAYDEVIHL